MRSYYAGYRNNECMGEVSNSTIWRGMAEARGFDRLIN